jgi:undecaprenyl diphosphate synthase
MSQSRQSLPADGLHVAIIMDGNGRWATSRGRTRSLGHVAGARVVRRMVEQARRMGVRVLTLYAFSGDNWKRPATEVLGLMRLFRRYLAGETERCVSAGIRLTILGRRDRLPTPLCLAVEAAEAATAHCTDMHLRIAIDYSARDAILRAAQLVAADGAVTEERFTAALGQVHHDPVAVPDVDLLIRTGGERRLSDFLLWESAYAELWFTRKMWPEITAADLEEAVQDFRGRERRFGGLSESVAG